MLLFIMVTLSTMPLTSCVTNGVEYIPFPEFPKLEQVIKNADGTVSMPSSDIVRLAEFKLKYDTLKELYGPKEKGSK